MRLFLTHLEIVSFITQENYFIFLCRQKVNREKNFIKEPTI